MNVNVRTATVNDLDIILKLNKELFDFEEQFTHEWNFNWTYSDYGKKYFTDQLKSKDSVTLIADDNSNPIGYMLVFIKTYTYRSVNPVAEIDNVYISDNYRGKGVGKMLMDKMKTILIEREVKRLDVKSLSKNIKAQQFYLANGFLNFSQILEFRFD